MKILNLFTIGLTALLISSCAISPETQAKMDEYARTIPACSGGSVCRGKWTAARGWVVANSAFAIRSESDERIMSTRHLTTRSGNGVVVNRVEANGSDQILVDVECYSAYGCPNIWDMKLDFNRTVNGANSN